MHPQSHLRISVAIRATFFFTGVGLAVYSLLLSVSLGWWLPRLAIFLSIVIGLTLIGFRLPISLIKVPCRECQGSMFEVQDSDPISYSCRACGSRIQTTWEQPSPHKD